MKQIMAHFTSGNKLTIEKTIIPITGILFLLLIFLKVPSIYSKNKNLASRKNLRLVTKDENKDGRIDDWLWIDTVRIKYVYREVDTNFDGKVDAWFWYNKKGYIARIEKDENFDGKPDKFMYSKYRKGFTKIEKDTNFDGKIDVWTYFWPKSIIPKYQELDAKHKGKVNGWVWHYRNGEVKKKAVDSNYDGKIDNLFYLRSDGTKKEFIIDSNFDGKFDIWYYFNKKGKLAFGARDKNGDGKPDKKFPYTEKDYKEYKTKMKRIEILGKLIQEMKKKKEKEKYKKNK